MTNYVFIVLHYNKHGSLGVSLSVPSRQLLVMPMAWQWARTQTDLGPGYKHASTVLILAAAAYVCQQVMYWACGWVKEKMPGIDEEWMHMNTWAKWTKLCVGCFCRVSANDMEESQLNYLSHCKSHRAFNYFTFLWALVQSSALSVE